MDYAAQWLPVIAILIGIGVIAKTSVFQIRQAIFDARVDTASAIAKAAPALAEEVAAALVKEVYRELQHEPGETNEHAIDRWLTRRWGFEEDTTPSQEIFFALKEAFEGHKAADQETQS